MILTVLFCKRTLFLLPGYLDRELAPEEMTAVRAHLSICHACREKLEFEASLLDATRQKLQSQAETEVAGGDFGLPQVKAAFDAERRESNPKRELAPQRELARGEI